MKKLIILLFIVFTTVPLLAQISGKSKAGRLFSKKSIPQAEEISEPKILIFAPNIEEIPISATDRNLTLRGKIEDEYGIESSLINGSNLNLINEGEFIHDIFLSPGQNRVTIEATNSKGKKAVKEFIVDYATEVTALPEIILFEPLLTSGKEYNTFKEITTLRGTVKNLNNGQLKINEIPITVSKDGYFEYQHRSTNKLNPIRLTALTPDNLKSELSFNIVFNEMTSEPKITIIEPMLPPSNELYHTETIITIRGRVDDNFDLRNIEVNNQRAALLGANEFFANINLNDGINNIVVTATNIKGTKTEKIFRIITPVDDVGPEITILEPTVSRGLKIVRKKDVLDVRGKVSDRSGVLNLTVNNREVTLLPNKEFEAKLFLGLGNNTIIVRATDNKYNVTIDTFYVTREEEQIIKTGKYIALVIGINSYEGYWHPLQNAVNDAKGLADVLKNKYLFHEVHTLLDKEATRKNIIQEFETLISNSSRDDNILIFYAGHGQFKRSLNKGYWVPVDAKTNSTADYISNNDIKTFIGGMPSKHTLLITDACFGGDIFRGSRTESIPFDPNDMTKYYREVYNKSSRLALTSGSLEQVSDAGKNNHSVFTYFLLKSLEDNDRKYFDAGQLFNDFRMAVVNNSDQTPQLQVVRDTNDEGGRFLIKKD